MDQIDLSIANRGDQNEVLITERADPGGCTLKRFTGWLTEIRDEQPPWRATADRESDYYDSHQYDSQTLRDMEEIGMPPIPENVMAPAIDAVLGLEAKTRTDWRVQTDHSLDDEEVATALNFKLNQAERTTRADRACADAYASQVKVGIGWVEVSRESDPFRYPYRISNIHRNEIFWDMRSREPDGSDMRFLIRRRWTDSDIAQVTFPEHKDLINQIGTGWSHWDEALTHDGSASTDLAISYNAERGWSIEETEWRDATRRRVCLFEVWYRDLVRGLVLQSPDGRVIEYDASNQNHVLAVASGVIEPRYSTFYKVRMAYWIGPHRLYDGPSPYKHNRFPYVSFWGKKEDRTGIPYGLCRPMIPMQDAINASESKMQWLLSARRIVQTEGVTVDEEEVVRREASRPDAHFILDAEKMRNGGIFRIDSDFALNQQQYQRLQDKREGIKRVSGTFNAFMGQDGQANSGLAINLQIDQSSQTLAEINDNYRFSRAEVGELLLSMIIEDIGEKEQVVQVQGKLPGDRATEIRLNIPQSDEMGIRFLNNDVQRARLKVALSDVPSTPSYRAQQLMAMSEVAKSLPQNLQAVIVPFMLKLMDVPDRDEVIKSIKNATEGGAITPEQMQQVVSQAVRQAITDAGLEIMAQEASTKRFAAEAKAHSDNLRAEADWMRAESGNIQNERNLNGNP